LNINLLSSKIDNFKCDSTQSYVTKNDGSKVTLKEFSDKIKEIYQAQKSSLSDASYGSAERHPKEARSLAGELTSTTRARVASSQDQDTEKAKTAQQDPKKEENWFIGISSGLNISSELSNYYESASSTRPLQINEF